MPPAKKQVAPGTRGPNWEQPLGDDRMTRALTWIKVRSPPPRLAWLYTDRGTDEIVINRGGYGSSKHRKGGAGTISHSAPRPAWPC